MTFGLIHSSYTALLAHLLPIAIINGYAASISAAHQAKFASSAILNV
jgi:hypothetical protein